MSNVLSSDAAFLLWLKQRLVFVHGENSNSDYIHRLDEIIYRLASLDEVDVPDDTINLYLLGDNTVVVWDNV